MTFPLCLRTYHQTKLSTSSYKNVSPTPHTAQVFLIFSFVIFCISLLKTHIFFSTVNSMNRWRRHGQSFFAPYLLIFFFLFTNLLGLPTALPHSNLFTSVDMLTTVSLFFRSRDHVKPFLENLNSQHNNINFMYTDYLRYTKPISLHDLFFLPFAQSLTTFPSIQSLSCTLFRLVPLWLRILFHLSTNYAT